MRTMVSSPLAHSENHALRFFYRNLILLCVLFQEPYGDNDGTIEGKFYFQAKKNHALFESADKIKSVIKKKDIAAHYVNEKRSPITTSLEPPVVSPGNKSINQSLSSPVYSNAVQNEPKRSKRNNRRRLIDVQSVGDEYEGHKINTRVVYFDENAYDIHGILRFLGYLDKFDDRIYAVVETVRQLISNILLSISYFFNDFHLLL